MTKASRCSRLNFRKLSKFSINLVSSPSAIYRNNFKLLVNFINYFYCKKVYIHYD